MMRYINTSISSEPVIIPGGRRIGSQPAYLAVTKIRNVGAFNTPHYEALVFDNKVTAPYDGEWPEGELWIGFFKSKNKHIKFPVLKYGETADV
jgi:hypothetical protein